ncbi:glycosyltransferase [bacterium]|nr:glycosyltransferase [bacterium]
MLDSYATIAGPGVIDELRQLARAMPGASVLHVNSTKSGGGVAEILNRLIPLKRELGIEAEWEVVLGEAAFYDCTKAFHNTLQGDAIDIPERLLRSYEETNKLNADRLRDKIAKADIVFIHDPQPAALIEHFPDLKNKWIWRCHIDVSRPYRPVWKYLRKYVERYHASIWHMPDFVRPMNHPQYLVPPSIDPLAEKNIELPESELDEVCRRFGLDRSRPIVVQVSRFDRFKDPIGVIQAYRLAKPYVPLQLVLAGGTATDDPEGQVVLEQVTAAAAEDKDIKILALPPDAHRDINALQRAAQIVLQKSTKEGFGLTVTEAMWKRKPVIGGNVGGIRLQITDHHTGFLVATPEGAAHRIRYLLKETEKREAMGEKAHRFVKENFLLTRHLREYLTLIVGVMTGNKERIELK